MSSPAQPHDRFFKHLFSEPHLVISYLRGSLAKEWLAFLNLDTLTRIEDSHIDEELQEQLTDMVYQCQMVGSDHHVQLIFLLEHKSYVPAYPHLQLLRYMLNLWQKQVKAKKVLQPIIPMVVYHGRTDWEFKPFGEYFPTQGIAWLDQFRPDFTYHLTNLRKEEPEEIEKRFQELILRKAFLLMKWIFDKDLIDHTETIFADLLTASTDQPESEYFRIFITYLSYSPNSEKNSIMAKVKSLTDTWELPPDSVAYQWVQELKQQGIEQGMELGTNMSIKIVKLLRKGIALPEIAAQLSVSLQQVQRISRELEED